MNVNAVMVGVGVVGFLITIGTAWQGRFTVAAGMGILTGAVLVAGLFVFRPAEENSTAGGPVQFPAAVRHNG
jgi:hypothetical protein